MQQVNLYQDVFKKQRLPIAADIILIATASLIVILVASYTYSLWHLTSIRDESVQLELQNKQLAEKMAALSKQPPKFIKDPILSEKLAALQLDVANTQLLTQNLQQRSRSRSTGFAEHLEGLSRQYRDGLWLTGIQIENGGAEINLAGSTRNPRLVAQFIKRLGSEPVFKGKHFNALELARQTERDSLVDFSLRTGGVGGQ